MCVRKIFKYLQRMVHTIPNLAESPFAGFSLELLPTAHPTSYFSMLYRAGITWEPNHCITEDTEEPAARSITLPQLQICLEFNLKSVSKHRQETGRLGSLKSAQKGVLPHFFYFTIHEEDLHQPSLFPLPVEPGEILLTPSYQE